ncbi:MAG TPA: penicillin-binding transpeptidase domain-containing protein [Pyrinomonadaceae bacterium]|nr:penicillin-binding transpeptidase domain-containing protein [Pyrinomonadaceae bacterium]
MRGRLAASTKARPDSSRRRALGVACFLGVWMLVIGVRLIYLQTAQHEWLTSRARTQQQDAIETSPMRGLVLDRHGNELARSIDTESFWAVPREVRNVEEASAQLAPLVEEDAATLATKLKQAQDSNKKFAWIGRKLDGERAARVRALNIAGVYSLKEPKRHYPNNQLASHILGFVGLDETGLAGIERAYDKEIRGEAGLVTVETDAHGRAYGSFEAEARRGETVVLTIDRLVQHKVEKALIAAVERTRAKSGSAIVLDPRTGEILALANAPTFDPNNWHNATDEARVNEALQNIYEPGSTFKIVAFSAAIERGLIKPDDRIDCQMGSITVAGRVVHDHHAFGSLTMTEALAKSSNVAAIKLGLKVGDDSMYDYMTRFGFGTKTGVELPGETDGLLRKVSRWQPSSMGSLAIGQEIGVTPLQMAAAFGTLANDGVRVSPHLVREVRADDGSILYSAAPEQRRVVSARTAQTLRGMLEQVTLAGTAKLAQLDGYTAAGKTGTAQKIDPKTRAYSKTKHIASFVGFAPVENPAVVIIVVIDEPAGAYHGGDVAAPIFREIAEEVLPALSVAPDTEMKPSPEPGLLARLALSDEELVRLREQQERDRELRDRTLPRVEEENRSVGTTRVVYAAATKRGTLMPDLRGRSVRDAARICEQLGLQLEARGEGRALSQSPAAGEEVEAGRTVQVDFGRSR